jgi:hypothetical protein
MRSLRDVLAKDFGLGASLAGWKLEYARGISADGQFIVGSGTNPSGNTEAWLARLALALPGDFNHDGTVDAADYVMWRKTDGTQTGYDTWRANFGQSFSFGSGASVGASSTIPEPATLTLLVVGMSMICFRRRR